MPQRQKQIFPFFAYKNDLQKAAQLVQQGKFSASVLGISKTVSFSIDRLCEYIEKEYPQEREIYLQKTIEVLANYMNTRNVTIKNIVSIKECVRMNLLFSFTSEQEMNEFIRLTFQSHLWPAIQYDYVIPAQTISLSIIELPKLKDYIQHLQDQRNSQYTLLEGNSSYRLRLQSENCQSKHQLIMNKKTTENQNDFSFGKINQILRKQDIFALKSVWDCQLMDTLDDISKNWEVYSCFLHKDLETFIMLNMYKMFKINSAYKNNKQKVDNCGPKNNESIDIYEQIYPKMNYFISFFSRKMSIISIQEFLRQKVLKAKCKNKYRSLYNQDEQAQLNFEQTAQQEQNYLQIIRKQLNIQENMADKMFYYFLKEQTQNQQKKMLNFSVMVDQQMPMKQYISICQDFYLNSSHWDNIFSSFSHQYFKQKKNHYFSHIEKERLVESRCLGCSKFFVLDQNIYDQIVNQCPIKVFPSIKKLKEIEATLKDQICGMLNNGGGIVLFNCIQQYRQIYPRGITMSQKNKQQCQQRLYSYISQFYPKLEVKAHVYISFVPVISLKDVNYDEDLKMNKYAGEEGILKDNYSFIQRDYFEGRFVTRIRIVPADPSLVYYWYIIPQSVFQPIRKYCQVNNNNGTVSKLKTRAMGKLIKKKMKHFYVKETFIDDEERNLLKFPSVNIQHQCHEPQIGIITGGLSKEAKRADKIINLEDKYTYLSLLVTKEENSDKIRQKFRRSRLNCELKVLFSEQKFKTAQSTIALYHNNKFQQILKEVNSNSSYIFNGRPVLIINVTSFLKLEKRNQNNSLTIDDFNYISSLFSKKYPNESLKLYQFKATQSKKQYYILTQSKVSNLYMYYLINQKKEKAIFKNPYLLDKLGPAEREQRMILQFEKKGRNEIFSQSNRKSAKFNQSYSINLSKDKNRQSLFQPKQQKQKDITLIETASSGYPFEKKAYRIIHVEKHLSQTQSNGSDQSQIEYLYENWKAEFELHNYQIPINYKSLNQRIYEYQS